MLEFDKEKYNKLRKDLGYSHEHIKNYLENSCGIETSIDTIKNWTRTSKKVVPSYERISALAELFGIPSLHLFVDGDKELENNIKHELKLNPEKYKKYFEKNIKSDVYADILNKLDTLDDEKLSAVSTIIKGL